MAYWKEKGKKQLLLMVVSVTIMRVSLVNSEEGGQCNPPLFIFGASMLDVGENEAAMPGREASEFPPYGLHYFGLPAARFSNGRLLIDFISQGLGYELVDPYLRSVGANFKHGVNFASSGATLANSTASADGSNSGGLFSLSVQIDQFRFFKAAVLAFNHKEDLRESILTIDDFLEGVYIIEIGHNDYLQFVFTKPDHNVDTFVTETIHHMKEALLRLYNEGARKIVVMNMLPLGCTPGVLGSIKPVKELQDEYGCLISFNNLVNIYNRHLTILLKELRLELPNAEWILFDIHGVIWNAVRYPAFYGVKNPLQACCGPHDGNYNFESTQQCGSPNATVCKDSTLHIFWDGIHLVESFHHILGKECLEGKSLIPKFLIRESCNVLK